MKKIQIKSLFKQGWESFKQHAGLLIGVVAVLAVVQFSIGLLEDRVEQEDPLTSIVVVLMSIFIGLMLQLGVLQIILNILEDREATIGQIIGDYRLVVPFLITNLVYAAIVVVGFILLIVPGVIWSLKYSQWQFLIVDKNLGVFESLKESARMTYGSKMDMFLLYLVVGVVVLLSLIPFGLGLIISIPFSMMVQGHVYKTLRDTLDNPQEQEETGRNEETQPQEVAMEPQS